MECCVAECIGWQKLGQILYFLLVLDLSLVFEAKSYLLFQLLSAISDLPPQAKLLGKKQDRADNMPIAASALSHCATLTDARQ